MKGQKCFFDVNRGLFGLRLDLMLISPSTMPIRLQEERNARRLVQWFSKEDERTLEFIDGGSWGRPITAQAIERQWDYSIQKQYLKEHRGRDLLWHGVFSAYLDSQALGHVEVVTLRNIDDEFSEINPLYVGQLWGMLLNLYVVGDMQNMGYGSQILRSACDIGFKQGADVMALIVSEENEKARRFYQKNGFIDTGFYVMRQGKRFLIIEYRECCS